MELAAILVGIAVAVIYYRQLKEMHKSTEAAQGAAIVATDTLKDARKNWQIEHRPIIWLTNQNYVPTYIDQSQQVVWDFHFANYGTVPIQKSECMKYMKIGDRDYEVSYGAKEPSIGPPLPPGGTVDYSMTVVSAPGVTKERFRRLLKIDNSISIKAVFEYTDVTGAKYQTGICLTRLASGAIAYCKDGNYIH